jgi:hypothetical protein
MVSVNSRGKGRLRDLVPSETVKAQVCLLRFSTYCGFGLCLVEQLVYLNLSRID